MEQAGREVKEGGCMTVGSLPLPQPHCSAPHTEIRLPASSTSFATSLGCGLPRIASPVMVPVQKPGKLGKAKMSLALLALMLFLMACLDVRLHEQKFLAYV